MKKAGYGRYPAFFKTYTKTTEIMETTKNTGSTTCQDEYSDSHVY
jgi:hypothetical protein